MTKIPTFDQLDQTTQDYFARITNRMIWESKRSQDYGTGDLLSQSEIEIIDRVVKNKNLTVTLVANQLGITKSAVSQLVTNLEKKGYLLKIASPEHKKILFLKATKIAVVASQGLGHFHKKLSSHLSDLSSEDLISHIKVCERIEAFLDNLYGPD